ncbi:hypothetical protein BH10ACT10_BH10ACT10_28940 [soil metagenome]
MIYVFVAVLVVGPVMGAAGVWRWNDAPRIVARQMADIAAEREIPLGSPGDAWLRPRLLQRERITSLGRLLGLVPSVLAMMIPGTLHVATYLFTFLTGASLGVSVGMYVAARRGFTPWSGPRRSAGTVARSLSGYVLPGSLRSQTIAVALTLAAVGQGVLLVVVGTRLIGVVVVVLGLVALAGMAAIRWLEELLVRRPLASRDSAELGWQEVLLAETVRPMTWWATWIGWVAVTSASIGGYVDRDASPALLVTTSTVLALAAAAAMVRHARDQDASSDRRNAHRPQVVRA